MRHRLHEHSFIKNKVRLSEARFDITDFPFVRNLATGRHLTAVHLGPVDVVPGNVKQVTTGHRVALKPSIGPTRAKTLQRIQCKRERFKIDLNLLNRIRRRFLRYRGHRQNRLAFIERLIRQHLL